jgi:hypothetical protein
MQAPRRRRASRFEAKTAGTDSDSDSDSSEDVPTFEYVDVDVSSGVSRDFFKYIGKAKIFWVIVSLTLFL